MSLSPFEQQIVSLVRTMTDEQILDLVREQLAVAGPAVKRTPRTTVARGQVASSPKARVVRPRGSTRSVVRTTDSDGDPLAARVEAFVLSSDGVAVKDVADGLGLPKPKASLVLRGLRDKGKIVQAGDRRFARYGANAVVAETASLKARGRG